MMKGFTGIVRSSPWIEWRINQRKRLSISIWNQNRPIMPEKVVVTATLKVPDGGACIKHIIVMLIPKCFLDS